jgi:hypothetical protein
MITALKIKNLDVFDAGTMQTRRGEEQRDKLDGEHDRSRH